MITVYGASDDCIEVEGDITEEFQYLDDDRSEGNLLAFSSGIVLRITFTASGVWRIVPVAGSPDLTIVHAPEDDEDNYSDRATLGGDVRWVVHGIGHAAAKLAAANG